jgi:hypothetical protein
MANPNLLSLTTVAGGTADGALTTTHSSLLANGASSGKILMVTSIRATNIDGTASVDVTFSRYNGTTHRYIASTIPVPADVALIVSSKATPMFLMEGESLYGSASVNSDAEYAIDYIDLS